MTEGNEFFCEASVVRQLSRSISFPPFESASHSTSLTDQISPPPANPANWLCVNDIRQAAFSFTHKLIPPIFQRETERACVNPSINPFVNKAIGHDNDTMSQQTREALASEGFRSLDDMRRQIKCVGDLVAMGVPYPHAKRVWRAIQERASCSVIVKKDEEGENKWRLSDQIHNKDQDAELPSLVSGLDHTFHDW